MKDYSEMHDAEINMLVCKQLGLGLSSYCRILSVGDYSILLDDNKTLVDYCNNPADAWLLLLRIVESGVILNIGKNEINGDALNGKSIARKITELYLGLRSD